MSSTAVVVIVLILLVAVVLGVVMARRRRSTQLQERFGPEYERSVSEASGDRRAAEAALTERQQRREEFDVRDLRPEERDRFRESWSAVQRGFVDDPRGSLQSADSLVTEIMQTRGYPVDDDFERRADDLSVDHPRVVQYYRDARQVHDAGGDVDTEHQRTAITSYRSLVDALLGDDEAHASAAPTTAAERTDHDRTTAGDAADDRRGDAVDATDADQTSGRHALREQDVNRPSDPNGPQPPLTEERTR